VRERWRASRFGGGPPCRLVISAIAILAAMPCATRSRGRSGGFRLVAAVEGVQRGCPLGQVVYESRPAVADHAPHALPAADPRIKANALRPNGVGRLDTEPVCDRPTKRDPRGDPDPDEGVEAHDPPTHLVRHDELERGVAACQEHDLGEPHQGQDEHGRQKPRTAASASVRPETALAVPRSGRAAAALAPHCHGQRPTMAPMPTAAMRSRSRGPLREHVRARRGTRMCG